MTQSTITNDSYGRNYQLHFGRIPNLSFQLTGCPLPTLSIGQLIQPTPYHDIPNPGDKITFDPFLVEYIVDENFASYLEIFNWIHECRAGNPLSADRSNLKSDATLEILTNNMTPILSFRFEGLFPTVLGEVQLTTQNGTDVSVGTATFAYQEFNLVV